jgi:hypothetical protein
MAHHMEFIEENADIWDMLFRGVTKGGSSGTRVGDFGWFLGFATKLN